MGSPLSAVPHAAHHWNEVAAAVRSGRGALLLDFDGTLAPIVDDPGEATLPDGAADVLASLAARLPVAVLSGRELADVRARVDVPGLWFAGSHGLELAGPGLAAQVHPGARDAEPALEAAEVELGARLAAIPGARLERKRFGVAAHSRQVGNDRAGEVTTAAVEVCSRHPQLRVAHGRRVSELRPAVDWDKGRALAWLLDRLEEAAGHPLLPVYIGDDLTDEDALAAARSRGGLGVVVRSSEHGDRPTAAHLAVEGPDEVMALLSRLA